MATEIRVLPDATTLSVVAAQALLTRLAMAQTDGRDPQMGLTGGSIAREIYREVPRLAADGEVDWSRVRAWWGDERFVPADSEERNATQTRADFLSVVGMPDSQVHEMGPADRFATAEDAADAYSEEIRTHGAGEFEVVMFGLGPDGHIASLFPGHPAAEIADRIAIAVHDSPKPPPDRVSLTFEAFARSRAVWFFVSGEDKAEAVARSLDPESTTRAESPAIGVEGTEETVWFLDEDAASLL